MCVCVCGGDQIIKMFVMAICDSTHQVCSIAMYDIHVYSMYVIFAL